MGFLFSSQADLTNPPSFVGPAYQPMGKIESGGEVTYKALHPSKAEAEAEAEKIYPIEVARKFTNNFGMYQRRPPYTNWDRKASVTKKDIGGKSFHPLATRRYAYVHTRKGREGKQMRRCMVYYHGGGAVFWTPEIMKSIMNRYAVEADVNIINVKYGLAPENKAPRGIADAYAAFMDVHTNPQRFRCDPAKIGFFGESGGGYITAGVGMMLAERGQSKLARFQIQIIPMTTNLWFRKNWEKTPGLNIAEKNQATKSWKNVYGWISDKPEKEWMTDAYLFPNVMSDKLAAKVPPVVLVTQEFDYLRYATREARDLYKRNGKLLHYIEYGGGYHDSQHNYAMNQSTVWFKDFKRLCDYYLQ